MTDQTAIPTTGTTTIEQRLEKTTAQLKELAEMRHSIDDISMTLKEMDQKWIAAKDEVTKSSDYINLRQALAVMMTQSEQLTSQIRAGGVKMFEAGAGKHPIQGIEIKVSRVVTVIVDEEKAFNWAYNGYPGYLSLNRSEFDEYAKALSKSGQVEKSIKNGQLPPSTEIKEEEIAKALISSDLSKYLTPEVEPCQNQPQRETE
jgi:hypothetical protein